MALEPKPLSSRKRQACDRCHGQKLRCMRAQQSPGPCQRCLLAKKECTFSYRLQMGRPRAPAPTASPWTETVWNLEDLDKLNAADQEEGHIPMEDTFLDMFGKICPIPPETSKDSGSGSENDPLTMSNQTQEDVFNESPMLCDLPSLRNGEPVQQYTESFSNLESDLRLLSNPIPSQNEHLWRDCVQKVLILQTKISCCSMVSTAIRDDGSQRQAKINELSDFTQQLIDIGSLYCEWHNYNHVKGIDIISTYRLDKIIALLVLTTYLRLLHVYEGLVPSLLNSPGYYGSLGSHSDITNAFSLSSSSDGLGNSVLSLESNPTAYTSSLLGLLNRLSHSTQRFVGQCYRIIQADKNGTAKGISNGIEEMLQTVVTQERDLRTRLNREI